jgi:lipoprotein-anchoring transpeptidase ErfK/SrfK
MRRLPLLCLAPLLAGCGATAAGDAAAPSHPAFVPAPAPGRHARPAAPAPAGRYLIARLVRPVRLRGIPGGGSLAVLRPQTEFRSPAGLAVTARRGGWLQVLTPRLANQRRGWIPAAAAELAATNLDIRVERSAHRAWLRRDGRRVFGFPVAVGRPGNETPLGRFAVTDKLRPADPTSPYGCCALALTGHQPHIAQGWGGGTRIAIHGTTNTGSIGTPASHGCLRASNTGMRRLMAVIPLGTTVHIHA